MSAMLAAWEARLAADADGLDFTDSEDRAIFRLRVAHAATNTRRHVLVDVVAALAPDVVARVTTAGLVRQIADAYIAKAGDLVEAVKAHALAHYEDGGWDVIVECWEDGQIADALTNAVDPIKTAEQAIAHFRDGCVAVWADRQADARNSAF